MSATYRQPMHGLNIKVLIVEDDDIVAKMLEGNIKRYYKNGVTCLRELNPYTAIDRLIQEDDIAVCLLDLGFPGMHRPGTTEAFDALDAAIKSHRLDTALVVVSGTSDEGIIKSIEKTGRKYLSKEETMVNPQELLRILSDVISKRSTGSSGREQLTKVEILANQINYRVDRVLVDLEQVRSQVKSNCEELYGGPGQEGMDTKISNLTYMTTREIQLIRETVTELKKNLNEFQDIINIVKGIRKVVNFFKEHHMAIIYLAVAVAGLSAAWFTKK